jgi:hypothetical protein
MVIVIFTLMVNHLLYAKFARIQVNLCRSDACCFGIKGQKPKPFKAEREKDGNNYNSFPNKPRFVKSSTNLRRVIHERLVRTRKLKPCTHDIELLQLGYNQMASYLSILGKC